MKTFLFLIALRITDSTRPLAERARVARWARSSCWHCQIARLVENVARDQAFASKARN